MNDQRPDPDALLGRIRAEEERGRRGKLKVFFGACPGVGKTYAMLQDARARLAEGREVFVGIVETHARAETEALLEGMPILPRREIEHRGVVLREFDLDAALAHPTGLILVDELAHSNAPGSRHARRWQDIGELLSEGIDVSTTINVQHIESLNDVVARITGVQVRETVPDAIVEEADEIVLVDLPPEELLKRLSDGKVYMGERAASAAEHFFRKPNLIALRELSLRFMANRVNVQVQFARRDETIQAIWPTAERLLVCVGPSPSSAKLIRAARRLAGMLSAEWIALTIETPGTAALAGPMRDQLLQNQRLAERLGAETISLGGERLAQEVIRYARTRNVTKIIVGKPVHAWWRERLTNTIVDQIVRLSGDIDVYVIRGEGEPQKLAGRLREAASSRRADYGSALAIVAACTAIDWMIYERLALPNLIMIYLAGIMVTAMRGRRGPSLMAAALSVLLFDVLFVPPRFTVAVSDVSYLPTFAVMLGVGVLISTLTLRLRGQVGVSDKATLRLDVQRRLGRLLWEARGGKSLQEAARLISETGQGDVQILMPDAGGTLESRAAWPIDAELDPKETGVARWSFDHAAPAGRGTDTLASCAWLILPLLAAQETLGVFGFRRADPVDVELMHLFESLAGQLALALEVQSLEERQRNAALDIETERMRSSILSSVSHDLRTPLATILGSSGSLLESGGELDPAMRKTLLQDIHDEAGRLNRLIANLLEMTRLEGGGLELRRELQPIEEIVGSALTALGKQLAGRKVVSRLPADLPPVDADGLLVQHVLINLLENALKYAPADKPIEVVARAEGEMAAIEVADRGPGLAPGEELRIFEKFFRGTGGAGQRGTGLGLAICKGIVEAHGGRIAAENRSGGGLLIRFTLPARSAMMSATGAGEPDGKDDS